MHICPWLKMQSRVPSDIFSVVSNGAGGYAEQEVYFAKGARLLISGWPTYQELAAATEEPVHVCNGFIYIGGEMPGACATGLRYDSPTTNYVLPFNGTCESITLATKITGGTARHGMECLDGACMLVKLQSHLTVHPDGSTSLYISDGISNINVIMSVAAVVALALFVGVSKEISNDPHASLVLRYGGILKDVSILFTTQNIWNEIVTMRPHPSLGLTLPQNALSQYHLLMVAANAVSLAIVTVAYNGGHFVGIHCTYNHVATIPPPFTLLGRSAFEIICLLTVGTVGPILPAQEFAGILQLAIGLSIAVIASRDCTAAKFIAPISIAARITIDAYWMICAIVAVFLTVPFCVDCWAVPVGSEIGVAVCFVGHASAIGCIYAVRHWCAQHSVRNKVA